MTDTGVPFWVWVVVAVAIVAVLGWILQRRRPQAADNLISGTKTVVGKAEDAIKGAINKETGK